MVVLNSRKKKQLLFGLDGSSPATPTDDVLRNFFQQKPKHEAKSIARSLKSMELCLES